MKGGNIENIYAINMHMRCIIPDLLKKNILLEGSEKFENKYLEQYFKSYRLHNKDNGFHLQFLHKCHTLLENPYDFELLGKIKSMCMFTFKINKISKKYVHVDLLLQLQKACQEANPQKSAKQCQNIVHDEWKNIPKISTGFQQVSKFQLELRIPYIMFWIGCHTLPETIVYVCFRDLFALKICYEVQILAQSFLQTCLNNLPRVVN